MTAQVHEKLIYEGEELSMTYCPLLPLDDPRIRILSEDEFDHSNPIVFSTACWRGYIGTWEIKDGKFYLVDLVGRYEMVEEQPMHADWFSGVIRIPRGEILQYVHMGFGSVYEEELHVQIEKGMVVESSTIDNRGKDLASNPFSQDDLPV
jgi:hypothetical protein